MNSLSSTKERQLKKCAFQKTILMLLVVLGHSVHFWTNDWFTKNPVFVSTFLKLLSNYISSFHIYTFTLISGYILFFTAVERGYNTNKHFFINKTKRLIVPYLFFGLVWVAPIQMIFLEYSKFEVLSNILLGLKPNQLWFLLMLFGVSVLTYFFQDNLYDSYLFGFIVSHALYLFSYIFSLFFDNFFCIVYILRYFLFFWIGFKIRQLGTDSIKTTHIVYLRILFIALFIIVNIISNQKAFPLQKFIIIALEYCLHVSGALSSFLILDRIADLVKWDNKGFAFFQERSMCVYLIHQQIIFMCIHYFNGKVNPTINALLNFIISLCISLALASIIMKSKTLRKLAGEASKY